MLEHEPTELEKMFPTKLTRWLLLGMLTTPPIAYKLAVFLKENIKQMHSQHTLILTVALLGFILVPILALIILDYALIIRKDKSHWKVFTNNNMHEFLSVKWLIKNSTGRLRFLFFLYTILMIYIGYFIK